MKLVSCALSIDVLVKVLETNCDTHCVISEPQNPSCLQMDVKEIEWRVWTGIIWLRIRSNDDLL